MTASERNQLVTGIGFALRGFRAAVSRFDATGPDDQLFPLVEALWWAVSVDEGVGKVVDDYEQRRNSDPSGGCSAASATRATAPVTNARS